MISRRNTEQSREAASRRVPTPRLGQGVTRDANGKYIPGSTTVPKSSTVRRARSDYNEDLHPDGEPSEELAPMNQGGLRQVVGDHVAVHSRRNTNPAPSRTIVSGLVLEPEIRRENTVKLREKQAVFLESVGPVLHACSRESSYDTVKIRSLAIPSDFNHFDVNPVDNTLSGTNELRFVESRVWPAYAATPLPLQNPSTGQQITVSLPATSTVPVSSAYVPTASVAPPTAGAFDSLALTFASAHYFNPGDQVVLLWSSATLNPIYCDVVAVPGATTVNLAPAVCLPQVYFQSSSGTPAFVYFTPPVSRSDVVRIMKPRLAVFGVQLDLSLDGRSYIARTNSTDVITAPMTSNTMGPYDVSFEPVRVRVAPANYTGLQSAFATDLQRAMNPPAFLQDVTFVYSASDISPSVSVDVPAGEYGSPDLIVQAIAAAINTAASYTLPWEIVVGTYTATTGMFVLSRTAGIFSLSLSGGAASEMCTRLGFRFADCSTMQSVHRGKPGRFYPALSSGTYRPSLNRYQVSYASDTDALTIVHGTRYGLSVPGCSVAFYGSSAMTLADQRVVPAQILVDCSPMANKLGLAQVSTSGAANLSGGLGGFGWGSKFIVENLTTGLLPPPYLRLATIGANSSIEHRVEMSGIQDANDFPGDSVMVLQLSPFGEYVPVQHADITITKFGRAGGSKPLPLSAPSQSFDSSTKARDSVDLVFMTGIPSTYVFPTRSKTIGILVDFCNSTP